MVDATHISFAANDRSYFALLKKEIRKKAEEAGFDVAKLNTLDLIVSEMTSNLFKYSNDGEILMGVINAEGLTYVELICIDNGPGMANPSKMLQDGISTSNTLGHGFGSMKRLSDVFEVYSQPAWGTIVLSRVYSKEVKKVKGSYKITINPIVVAKPGEDTSGDGLVYKRTEKYIKIMLMDGLGHGPEANKAINEAAAAFKIFPDYSPTDTLRFLHTSIKKTRGAVINIIGYDVTSKEWTTAGIGNIALRMIGPGTVRNHMSYNGIVGHNIPGSMNDQHYATDQYNQIVLCSDGIKTRWELNKYPLIHKYDATVQAAAIYKDHARRTDDMSVVVVKIR